MDWKGVMIDFKGIKGLQGVKDDWKELKADRKLL